MSDRKALSIVLAGGGTAGHVNPLLAVADALRERHPDARITVLGTAEGLESRLVPQRGYELTIIPRVPMPRRPNADALKFPARYRKAIEIAKSAMLATGADVVVGFGGYVSTPAYRAAKKLGLPIVVHEANALPGLANRVGAKTATAVAVTFPSTELPGAQLVGLPLRREIAEAARAARADSPSEGARPRLLVTGGSLGAQHINEVLSAAAADLRAAGVDVLHAAGRGKSEPVIAAVASALGEQGERFDGGARFSGYEVREYLDDMVSAYRDADLVVARSGAATVSELAALGKPAAFVPLPMGNGEQRINTAEIVAAGGAIVVADGDLNATWVKDVLLPLLGDPEKLASMAQAARGCGRLGAAERMVDLIEAAAAKKKDVR